MGDDMITAAGVSAPMKVVLLCHSDAFGGAAIVTYRLMYALRSCGVDARMVVFNKSTEDELVDSYGKRADRGMTFLGERLRIALANGFSRRNLFKVSTASTGLNIHRHPWIKEADVVVLNWINQGFVSLSGIRKIAAMGKPIVWTMHDMWPLTGICHHAYECRGYKTECGNCQFLSGRKANDLSHKVWKKKQHLYDEVPVTFVAVSNWLAERCRESSLLRGREVRVIPNAFPIDSFTIDTTADLGNLALKKNVIIMGAARLDDPIKGLGYAINALNHLFDNEPELARDSQALLFGELRDRTCLDSLRFPYRHLGRIHDPNLLRQLYASSKVVLSASLYETLPGTVIEGMAAGCVPVSFGRGGQRDIFTHKTTGYIAEYKNYVDLAEGIKWALTSELKPDALHEEVRRRFSFASVAQNYVDLFATLVGR